MPVTVEGTVQIQATLGAGLVSLHPSSLTVNINSFRYDIGGLRGIFDGAVAQTVTDDDTSYVYLDEYGSLQITTSGYPECETHLALARITAANGEIVSVQDERVLLGSSSSSIRPIRLGFPLDSGIRGGNAAASSNNNIPSITFAAAGESRIRWTFRPPLNWKSDEDLVLRLHCSVAGTPGDVGSRWDLRWSSLAIGDVLVEDYDDSASVTFPMVSVENDTLFKIELTMPAADFSKSDDFIALQVSRDGDHAEDDCSLLVHLHMVELVFVGKSMCGQPGQ